ncbi:murein hydrolase activator EnvC family protein [Ammonifex thiophilus]|uniref:M23 family peptidase n=1 Tax=Ammonifex thiophilus TaxID=444093 RepID=A0A3D8P7B1_9THEO|nr:M23 family metallopeptidase [Ammonifex thiophilus]RDV84752.1 M23 family peptidase [Ammonifex thiophilus]
MPKLGYRPQLSPVRPRPGRSLVLQVVAALVLFLIIWGLKKSDSSWSARVEEGLRWVLTTEWNYRPVIERVLRHGLEMVNLQIPFLGEVARPVGGPEPSSPLLPVSGKVVRPFGWYRDADGLERFSSGILIAGTGGAPVKAVAEGLVVKVGIDPTLGNYVLVDQGNGVVVLYGQLGEVAVAVGQKVKQGEVLGRLGAKGELLLEYRERGKPVDPLKKLGYTR